MIEYKKLGPSDLEGSSPIDRRDVWDHWCIVRDGAVVLEERTFNHPGFTQAQWDEIVQELSDKLVRDQTLLFGAYDGETLVGIAGLETDQRYGRDRNLYNFSPMWIDKAYRGQGIGKQLFSLVRKEAEQLDIDGMYISATPVPGTVDFYTSMGCRLLNDPDPSLLAEEPEDIHMVLMFSDQLQS